MVPVNLPEMMKPAMPMESMAKYKLVDTRQ
jgi:hypothetical protein